MNSLPGVVVVGGHINGLGLVRSLAARGVRTAVINTEHHDLAHRSRAVCAWDRALHLDHEPWRLRDVLARRARDWAGWALLPSNDSALLALEHGRHQFASSHPLCIPDEGIIPRVLDKGFMRDVALRAGLDLPAHYGPAVSDNPALDRVRFPAVVKPRQSQPFGQRFGRKLFVVRDRAELLTAIARVEEAGIPSTLDAWIDGGDDQLLGVAIYLGRDGSVSRAVCARKIRQGPPFAGVARVAEIAPPSLIAPAAADALRDSMVALLRPLGFVGVADAEFKRDPQTGVWHFIEVNCRSVLYNSLLRAGGFDIAGLAYDELVTGRPSVVTPIAWPGVWVNLHADLLYSVAYRHRDPMTVRRFLAPYRRPVLDAVWSARDPGPALSQWAHTAGRALRLSAPRRREHRTP